MTKKVLPWIKNKYALTVLFFFFWILTFESTNVFRLFEYRQTIEQYEDEIELYKAKIVTTKNDIEELKDPVLLEKFAR
ncbi:MAG: septum formation initiator family protein, partial [Bacteroidota bacterium]